MRGAASFPKPDGSPRFRRVMRVLISPEVAQVYVGSIGNGPSAARITRRSPGRISTNSYVYAGRRPARVDSTDAPALVSTRGRGERGVVSLTEAF
ncbi:MAG: hypothetical protein HYV07_03560 [Deltaproteobacteria bacterium]|nr:hypothetical protein [Deltaproteobacteria bacterium]